MTPTTAQFLTIDPLIAVTGTPYAYVAGNPLNHTDPTGQDCGFWCWVGIGAVTGAAVAIGIGTGGFGGGAAVVGWEGAVAAISNGSAITWSGGAAATAGLGATAAQGLSRSSSSSGNSSSSSSSRSVDDVLNNLDRGRSENVWTVDSDDELEQVYDELTDGASDGPYRFNYDGSWKTRPDGARIGLRGSSRSGGRTIDISRDGQPVCKIHVK